MTTTTATNQTTIETAPESAGLPDRTVILEVSIHTPGNQRRVPLGEINREADPEFVRASKHLFDPKAMGDIKSLDNEFKSSMDRRALTCSMLRGGLRLIPMALIEDVDTMTTTYQKRRAELADEFVSRLDEIKAEAEKRLGPLYRETEYPTAAEIRAAFKVRARFWSFDVPQALKGVRKDLWEREKARVEAEWKQAATDVQDALRVALADMVDHLVDRLADTEDGKRRIFKENTVIKVQEFLDTFAARNVTDDDELAKVVRQAKEVIGGRTAKEIRKSEDVRDYVRTGLQSVQQQLDGLVVSRRRTFALDDD